VVYWKALKAAIPEVVPEDLHGIVRDSRDIATKILVWWTLH
jgi:hypothetical protein